MYVMLRLAENVHLYPSYQTFIENREKITKSSLIFFSAWALIKFRNIKRILTFKLHLLFIDNKNKLFKSLAKYFLTIAKISRCCNKTKNLGHLNAKMFLIKDGNIQ